MKIQIQYADGVKQKDLALSLAQMKTLFAFLEKRLKDEKEFKEALEILGVKKIGSVTLLFCQDLLMRKLQNEHRNLDRTTDILSFPAVELEGLEKVYPLMSVGERSWGEMVLSLETVARGARRGKRTVARETLDVLIHGFLHLLGHDHVKVSKARAQRMMSLQRKIYLESQKKFKI